MDYLDDQSTGMEGIVYIEPLRSLSMNNYGGEPIPSVEAPKYWVYRVELVLHNDDGTIHDWAIVKISPWEWGEPCIDDQLRDWAIQYMPDWLILDARLATGRDLELFADEES